MAKIRNVSGEPLYVAGFGAIDKDAVVEVPDAALYMFTASANFEPVNKHDQALHDKAVEAETAAVKAEDEALGRAPATAAVAPDAG